MLVGVRDRPHLELEILQSSQRTKTRVPVQASTSVLPREGNRGGEGTMTCPGVHTHTHTHTHTRTHTETGITQRPPCTCEAPHFQNTHQLRAPTLTGRRAAAAGSSSRAPGDVTRCGCGWLWVLWVGMSSQRCSTWKNVHEL